MPHTTHDTLPSTLYSLHATGYIAFTIYYTLLTAHCTLDITCYTLYDTHYTVWTAHYTIYTTCYTLHEYMLHATCYMLLHTTCYTNMMGTKISVTNKVDTAKRLDRQKWRGPNSLATKTVDTKNWCWPNYLWQKRWIAKIDGDQLRTP